jgi:predicted alpha/beta superfamily hydrolase
MPLNKKSFDLAGVPCTYYAGEEAPAALLIQPADEHDLAVMDHEAALIAEGAPLPFALAAFKVADWDRDLSPWPAPPVFGDEAFGDGAAQTLDLIEATLLPGLVNRMNLNPSIPVVLGGYSLAGLFALWSAYQTDRFAAAAAVSPSVWFPGWLDYAKAHTPKAGAVYLSLGGREDKTHNPVMATVGDCIREQHGIFKDQGVPAVLEWNPGNHFKDPDKRCAKGFGWCLEALKKSAKL